MELKHIFLLFFCLLALGTDSQSQRIPNGLILFSFFSSFLLRFLQTGPSMLPDFFSALLLVCALLFPLFSFRMVGAGDIKFLSVLSALLGLPAAWRFLLTLLFVSALFSLFLMCREGNIKTRFLYFFTYLKLGLFHGKKSAYRLPGKRPENMPLGLPMCLAALVFILQSHFS